MGCYDDEVKMNWQIQMNEAMKAYTGIPKEETYPPYEDLMVPKGRGSDEARFNKVAMNLVMDGFRDALLGVGVAATFGHNKHPDEKWKEMSVEQHLDAMYRHLLVPGPDQESGLPNLYHAAWRMLAALQKFEETK